MTINEKIESDKIVLEVEGKVDRLTTQQLQDAILLALQKMRQLEIDFGGVNYISSAGLRALLMGQKTAQSKQGRMYLTKVTEPVKEIFNITGFSSFLEIQ
ncbi:STAS domain-containing protein [Pseudobutyrivibrio sp.]|uniref:STAS domain-containing protein n=1 Tax=Pseudobutyrivibrio sp. TaxID=2014367 RepID=UPI001B6C484F|nr:STAS domain-containing protein [Pseudobutyrivibrio sp.]MBP3261242.1 STAS domain-containing protein [Pseudobutyrivibrio sp.]